MSDPAPSPSPASPSPAAPALPARPKRRECIDVTVEGIDHRGLGRVPVQDGELRIRFAPPGAHVRARVLKRRGKGVWDAVVDEVLDPGPHASEARCPHAGFCGGCALPRLAYDEQLRQKRALVAEALRVAWAENELEGADALVESMPDVLGAPELEGYRNKMDFTFGSRRYVLPDEPQGAEASFGLGLHVPRFHQKVLDIEHCAIAFGGERHGAPGDFPAASAIVNTVREVARALGLEPWDLRDHTGLLRHLVVRRGVRTNEVLVNLVTSARAAERIDPFVAAMLERHPGITTVVQSVTQRLSTVAVGDEEHVLHGPGFIEEVLCGRRFRISADSFFQTNTVQAERLFEIVAELARPALAAGGPDASLFDLYCGAGTIGLAVGADAGRIVGFESVPSAVRDARANAELNGVTNAVYHGGDVLETMKDAADERTPAVVIVDPPRAGLHPKVPARVAALGSPRIVVVSCNPRTGARDVAKLLGEGYRLTDVRPVDLFPHTPHVEVVFGLERER